MPLAKVQTTTGPTWVTVDVSPTDGSLQITGATDAPTWDPHPPYTGPALTGPVDPTHLLVPVRPSKIICIGRNYRDHAAELGSDIPTEPLIFLKPPSSLLAPNATVLMPAISTRVDYEGELAIIIGDRCSKLAPTDDPAPFIYGYTLVNDVTARDLQKSDPQWTRAKGFDTFCPAGPIIRQPDDDFDPLERPVTLTTHVNGALRQQGSTADFIFDIPTLIRYLSNIFTLEPGDLIPTGTPAGVSPVAPGDTVSITIPGLSTLTNPFARA